MEENLMESIYERTSRGYTQQGDYLSTNLQLNGEPEYNIGIWGQRYRQYLKTQHKVIYYNYLTKSTLYQHLAEVDERAECMFNQLVKSLAEKENITEQLKKINAPKIKLLSKMFLNQLNLLRKQWFKR